MILLKDFCTAKRYILDKKAHRLLSVSDSSESKTAAPINKYVNVHTTSDKVRTFCRFIVPINEIPEVTFEELFNTTHEMHERTTINAALFNPFASFSF